MQRLVRRAVTLGGVALIMSLGLAASASAEGFSFSAPASFVEPLPAATPVLKCGGVAPETQICPQGALAARITSFETAQSAPTYFPPNRNALAWDGNSTVGQIGFPFSLGTLTYQNVETTGDDGFGAATLRLAINVVYTDAGGVTRLKEVDKDFFLSFSGNDPGSCPGDPNPCPDAITFNGLTGVVDQWDSGTGPVVTRYTLRILGFDAPGGTYVSSWTSPENDQALRSLSARIDTEVVDNRKPQTISFDTADLTRRYGDAAPYVPDATASSGLPITYQFVSTNDPGTDGTCSLNASGEVEFTGVQVCKVTATQPGNDEYLPAAPKTKTILVFWGLTTTTATDRTVTYDGTPQAITATTSPSTSPLTPALTPTVTYDDQATPAVETSTTPPTDAGVYTAKATFARTPLWEASSDTATLTIAKATPVVSVRDETVTYDGTPQPVTATATGAQGEALPVQVTYDGSPTAPTDAGTYSVVASTSATGNYEAASQSATLTVDERALTVVADDKTRKFGEANPPLTGTITGAIDGDGIAATYSTTATPSSFAGEYPIVPALTANPRLANYDVALTNGTLTVEPLYEFTGFFQPVDNDGVLNGVKAGSAVPLKFVLKPASGLDVFAVGYPRSQQIVCDTKATLDAVEETVTAGGSSLTYDPSTGRYQYVWKTDKAWAGTCRKVVLKFLDGTEATALFKFR